MSRAQHAELGGQRPFSHAIILDGQYLGNWRRKLNTRSMTIETQLLRPIDRAERTAVAAAVDRYAQFVGLPATWTVVGGAGA